MCLYFLGLSHISKWLLTNPRYHQSAINPMKYQLFLGEITIFLPVFLQILQVISTPKSPSPYRPYLIRSPHRSAAAPVSCRARRRPGHDRPGWCRCWAAWSDPQQAGQRPSPPGGCLFDDVQWIGLRENLNRKPWFFTIKYRGVRFQFSRHPILWDV